MTSREKQSHKQARSASAQPHAYPFTRIVGQEEMKLALLLNAVEPAVGGALVMGHRGTAKSTAVRALARLLPPVARVPGCRFNCDPGDAADLCAGCSDALAAKGRLPRERSRVAVVELPLNATEDRVCGTIDLERALREGVRSFEPGLLARAHRGFLYVDEVNLLDDHLVDLLLDVAAAGRNRVEREGVSVEHPARFVLVGSGNPEEGELRPQLLDRFGLCAEIRTSDDVEERVRIVTLREAFDRDPAAFCAAAGEEEGRLASRLARARRAVSGVGVPTSLVRSVAELCARLGVDGHRGELTVVRAARALAALEGRRAARESDARRVAPLALRHRLRRDPFGQGGGAGEVERLADELLGPGGGSESAKTAEPGARAERRATGAAPAEGARTLPPEPRRGSVGAEPGALRGESNLSGAARTSSPEKVATEKAATLDAPAPFSLSSLKPARREAAAPARTNSSREGGGRVSEGAMRGRHSGAVSRPTPSGRVAIDATLRAAALARPLPTDGDIERRVAREDLRYKRLARRRGALYIFAVDTSGSMALNRIGQAKGALARLLRQSYVNRDEVALVSFRGEGAELLLRPSRSAPLAGRLLDALPVGGPTPLAAGLGRALETASRARRTGAGRIVLLVFTDGRANVALGGAAGERAGAPRLREEIERLGEGLRRAGVESVVVDTRTRFGGADGEALAAALGGRYTRLAPGREADPTRWPA